MTSISVIDSWGEGGRVITYVVKVFWENAQRSSWISTRSANWKRVKLGDGDWNYTDTLIDASCFVHMDKAEELLADVKSWFSSYERSNTKITISIETVYDQHQD